MIYLGYIFFFNKFFCVVLDLYLLLYGYFKWVIILEACRFLGDLFVIP